MDKERNHSLIVWGAEMEYRLREQLGFRKSDIASVEREVIASGSIPKIV